MVLALGVGCAPTSELGRAREEATAEQIFEAVRTNTERVEALQGSGRLTVESPEINESASFSLYLRKPDTVMIRVEGPFGIEVGAGVVTRESFLFYNALQNQVIRGPSRAENLHRALRMNLSFDDVLSIFIGEAAVGGTLPDTTALDNGQYTFIVQTDKGWQQCWVDPSTLMIARTVQFNAEGRAVLERRFESFTRIDNVLLPATIRMIHHTERRMLTIVYAARALNANAQPVHIRIPESATSIRLQ
jgi:hypothetical protein